MEMIRWFLVVLIAPLATAASPFAVEVMPKPAGVDAQIGGMDVMKDGRIAVCFHRGEVMMFDPQKKEWSMFASGLQEPLGLLVESDNNILVMQRAELTRLRDTDGDGRADFYETVFDGFGMTGNYHEFAFGPVRGPDGASYIALNVASNGAGIREEIRGEWSEIGALSYDEMIHGAGWGKKSGKAGRMYSRVPWRGWVLKVNADGSMEPFASGFRSPDGLGFDAAGRLLVTDNQGDWRGTSPLHYVRKGGFYGHPASLVWKEGWDKGDPLKIPAAQLDAMRHKPAARFPQGDLANSPTQPLVFPDAWGPFAGQVVIGEMNQQRLVRFLADEVAGELQGALVPMLDGSGLGKGNHRLAFGNDGTLWVGKTHLKWAGGEGLVSVKPKDFSKMRTVTSVHLEKAGERQALRIALSQPLSEPGKPLLKSYDYHYHKAYGSPKISKKSHVIHAVRLEQGGSELIVEFDAVKGSVHAFALPMLGDGGFHAEGMTLYYQVNALP